MYCEDRIRFPGTESCTMTGKLWIDSDIVFNTEKFWQLILMDQDIASGWYLTEDGRTTSVAHWMEEDDFRNNGGVMNHETQRAMPKRT